MKEQAGRKTHKKEEKQQEKLAAVRQKSNYTEADATPLQKPGPDRSAHFISTRRQVNLDPLISHPVERIKT